MIVYLSYCCEMLGASFVTWPCDPQHKKKLFSYFPIVLLSRKQKQILVQQSATPELLLKLFQFQDYFYLIIPKKFLQK